jgi:hypothetical protein
LPERNKLLQKLPPLTGFGGRQTSQRRHPSARRPPLRREKSVILDGRRFTAQ